MYDSECSVIPSTVLWPVGSHRLISQTASMGSLTPRPYHTTLVCLVDCLLCCICHRGVCGLYLDPWGYGCECSHNTPKRSFGPVLCLPYGCANPCPMPDSMVRATYHLSDARAAGLCSQTKRRYMFLWVWLVLRMIKVPPVCRPMKQTLKTHKAYT